MAFREDLLRGGAEKCGGVFPGACDRDIPAMISERLKSSGGKQFIYWLTLNSHIPVPASDKLRTKDCERFDPVLARDHAMICRLFSMWNDTNEELGAILTDPDLPPTDVLIVGDHAPPFFDRSQRSQFDSERVPWVLLKHRKSREAEVTG
jgi:phosphoglycerol transferase MdoB-like AlkP superfamily enzyme